jgi:uncharacterized protein (DUF1330 family)
LISQSRGLGDVYKRQWYHSEAYQAIIHHRKNNSTGNLILVDGYSPG